MDDSGIGFAVIIVVVFVIFVAVAAGYGWGAGNAAEAACLAQGFDAGEWVDGAIQCVTYGAP